MSYIFSNGGGGGSGDVVGPASATDSAIVLFDGTTGKLIKDSGTLLSSLLGAFDATVGATGADYTTISAAIADSKTRLLVIDNVTETSACAVPSTGMYVYLLKGVTIDMQANQFTFAGDYNPTFFFQDKTSRITWAYTAAANTRLFATGANTGAVVSIFGEGTLDNNSTQSGCYVQDTSSVAIYEKIWYEPPNVANCGVYIGNVRSKIDMVYVTSPGTTATDVVRADEGKIDGIVAIGTFTNSNNAISVQDGIIDGVFNTGNLKIAIAGSGTLSNVNQGGGTLNIDCDGDAFSMDNVYVTAGTIAVDTGSDDGRFNNVYGAFSFGAGSDSHTLTGCTILNAFTMAGLKNLYSACVFTGAVTVSGDQMGASGCNFNSTLSFSSGADNNRFSDNDYAGNVDITGDKNRLSGFFGTGITLTLNSGAEYNNIDVTIDQAVTDSSGNATNGIAQIVY